VGLAVLMDVSDFLSKESDVSRAFIVGLTVRVVRRWGSGELRDELVTGEVPVASRHLGRSGGSVGPVWDAVLWLPECNLCLKGMEWFFG